MTIWVPTLSGIGPTYRQIADGIDTAIADGTLPADTKLPPQRRLADALGVTTGTISRAYEEAERRGRVAARVGSGTYVRGNKADTPAFSHVSQVRESDDGIDVSLALPPPSSEREAGLARAMAALQRDPWVLRHAIDYQPEGGLVAHRECMATWLNARGLEVDSDELVVTQGGMNGIFLALSALTQSGQRVAAEQLTYPGLISVAAQLALKLVPIPLDGYGMDIDALAARHERESFDALYIMPDHQNPTTVALSESRRQALVALARERDFWLIEDGVLYMPPEDRGTPLYQLAPERTIYLFSWAKILGGGMRSGVMRVPPGARDRVKTAIRNQSWMPPPLMANLVCQWIESGDADRLLAWQIDEMRARHDIARQCLGAAFQARRGGFYIWLALPEGQRASTLIDQLARESIRLTDAEAFCVGIEPAPRALRICISAPRDRAALEYVLTTVRQALEYPLPCRWQTV